jgi:ParB family transcriptional regulator, chromosome partitioning protein
VTKIVAISPFKCKLWDLHDRLDSTVSEETCKAEIESFRRHGQIVPALGRLLKGDPNYEVEIVCGARRLFVARHLNTPLLVEIRSLSVRDAIIAMDIENQERQDLSAYELGLRYSKWLRREVFLSQDELSKALRKSPAQISRCLKIAKLPAVIIAAFESPREICEAWGTSLADAWLDPHKKAAIARRARSIAASKSRLPSAEIYRDLLSCSARGTGTKGGIRDEVVHNDSGIPVFRVRRRHKWISILLPNSTVSTGVLHELKAHILTVMEQAPAQSTISSDR